MQKIIISGNLGKDAELSKLESGRNCIRFNVAANSVKGKGEERKVLTQWYGVSYFVNNEGILQYLKRGAKVVVCGNLELDIFKSDKTGSMYVNANVLATDVEIVGFVDKSEESTSAQEKTLSTENDDDLPDFLK